MNIKKKTLSLFLVICLITLTAFQTSAQPGVTSHSFLGGEDQELLATPGTTATPSTTEEEAEPEDNPPPEPTERMPRTLNAPNPYFTYSGNYDYVEYATGKYYAMLLTNGTFTPKLNLKTDVFLVGGGSSGNYCRSTISGVTSGGGGGGGGYTTTVKNISLTSGVGVSSTIGAGGLAGSASEGVNGGITLFGSYSANGGTRLINVAPNGGNGGSGGGTGGGSSVRAQDGAANGGSGSLSQGQGTTTYAFGGDKAPFNSMLYAGGGGGGGAFKNEGGSGGAGGGGAGGNLNNTSNATTGASNTGGGGGGGGYPGGGEGVYIGADGGSGIIIVRWENSAPVLSGSVTVPTSVNQWQTNTLNISYPTGTDADGDALTYVIEYAVNGSGTFTQLTTTSSKSYTFTIPGTKPSNVRFRVKVRDIAGLESGYLTSGWVNIIYNSPPTTPTNMQNPVAVNSWDSNSITFSCGSSSDANGDTIYYVWDISINGGAFATVQSTTSRSYTHTISIPSHSYIQARVRAYDGIAYSAAYLTSGIVSISHDTTVPTIQVVAVPDAVSTWVADEVTITVIVADTISGLDELVVPEGVTPAGNIQLSGMNASYTFKASENQTYAFVVYDKARLSSFDSVSPSKIDSDDPVIEYEMEPPAGEFTNGNVTIDLNMFDGSSGLANLMSVNGSEALSGNTAQRSFSITSNSIVPFSVQDLVSHITSINVPVNQIDRIKPVAHIVPRVKQWTKAASVICDVYGTDDYSGVASLMLPDASLLEGAAGTYEIFNNEEFIATATDRASNISDVNILDYPWFDRTKPTIQFVKFVDTSNPVINFFANLFGQTVTNKHVKIEVTADDTPEGSEGESGVTHMFYRVFNQAGELVQDWTSSPIGTAPVIDYDVNGSVEIYIQDAAQNDSDSETHGIIIDTKIPEVEIVYSTTETTNDPVEVTLRIITGDGSPAKGWMLPEGGVLVPGAEITYTFSENAVKTFIAYNTAGTPREVEIRITNIEALKVPVELWENNKVVIDAVLHAVGKSYIEDVTYNDLLKITYIDMSANFMDSIPAVFSEVKNLEHLDLRGNEFTELPECVYKLDRLKYLDVSNNNLIAISDEIRNLTRLNTFDVSLNYLDDYDCPLIVPNYQDAGNFTSSGKDNQYHFNLAEPEDLNNQTGNTVQINVQWFYDGQPINRLEDHRKVLYMGLYPQYRTYRPLIYRYEARYGQVYTATPDYAQVSLRSRDVEMELNLKLGA